MNACAEHSPIRRLAIANRGEIAARLVRACAERGVEPLLLTSVVDKNSLAAQEAAKLGRVVCIGGNRPAESYLNKRAVIAAAVALKADAIHPGYGFLSEDGEFAEECGNAGVRFVGPSPHVLRLFGDKAAARRVAMEAGVPVSEGSPPLETARAAVAAAERIGFPVLLKAVSGGGGRGMRLANNVADVADLFGPASAEAQVAFGDGRLYLERFMLGARHVEVQVAGDGLEGYLHFGDRDCSVQRRHQKVIEEAPAPRLNVDVQEAVRAAAISLVGHVRYTGIGTVEFLVDPATGEFAFLEVNARIQVEHGVTELVTGRDLVQIQLELADGNPLAVDQRDVVLNGSAIECRLNAEDPAHGFRPSPGQITRWSQPGGPGIRVDTAGYEGYTVPPFYDSLVAKVMCHATGRQQAIDQMVETLGRFEIGGIATNRELLLQILARHEFRTATVWTSWLESEVLAPPAPSPG